MESLTYTFQKEVGRLNLAMQKKGVPFQHIFTGTQTEHPYILKSYLRNDTSIETLVILNKLDPFVNQLDIVLKEDILWPDVSRIIKKYAPFLNAQKDKYDRILRREIGYN